MLSDGIILDRNDAGARQLQAHAERLGLDRVQVFRARRVGKGQTYLVVEWLDPVFQHAVLNAVTAHRNRMIQAHACRHTHGGPLCT